MKPDFPASTSAESPALRGLPSVDALLQESTIATLAGEFPREEIVRSIRQVVEARRQEIRSGGRARLDVASIALDVREALHERARPLLRRVINATGIVLHTGLGRAPLAEEAVQAIAELAGGYCNLEFDLASGERGDRHAHVRQVLCELTGAEDALVVNNNAAATLLTLAALATNAGVVVSRGELVEIGGSYRMPDIMTAAGCRLIEVGTTNRTRIADYERAIQQHDDVRVLLRVHTSNYRIEGFTESAALADLVKLAQRPRSSPLAVIDDLGSGLLDAAIVAGGDSRVGRWAEPTVRESVGAGVDLTLYSGDKLLGGPQAGIVVGRSAAIAALQRHPLARAFRPGKLTLAALEATLRLYRDPATLAERIPTYRLLLTPPDVLRARAESLVASIAALNPSLTTQAQPDSSFAGGGSLPTLRFPTWLALARHAVVRPMELAAALRGLDTPIVARVTHEALAFDCRTLTENDAQVIPAALASVLADLGG